MHEMSIIKNVIELLYEKMKENNINKLETVTLDIGGMHGVIIDALQFNFEIATADTDLKGTKLKINIIPIKIKCLQCGKESIITNYQFFCPICDSSNIIIISGNELNINSIEW